MLRSNRPRTLSPRNINIYHPRLDAGLLRRERLTYHSICGPAAHKCGVTEDGGRSSCSLPDQRFWFSLQVLPSRTSLQVGTGTVEGGAQ